MTNIKVKITSTELSTREGVSQRTGNPWKMTTQEMIVELNDEVRKVPLTIPENHSAYAIGNYEIDPLTLISVGRYGFEISQFGEIKLIPVNEQKPLNFGKAA